MSDIRAIGEGEHTLPYVLNTSCVILRWILYTCQWRSGSESAENKRTCLRKCCDRADHDCQELFYRELNTPVPKAFSHSCYNFRERIKIDIRQRLGESDCEYIQRHISIRFGDNPAIVFNTKDDEIIREQIIPCDPFKAGERFDFRAYVDVPKGAESNQKDEKFMIFANRKLIGSFEIPYANECSNNVLISGSLSSLKIFRVTNYLLSSEHAGCWVGMNYGFTIKSRLDMAFIIKGPSGFVKIDKIRDAYGISPAPPQFNMLQINIDYDKRSIIIDSNDSGENGQNCDNFPLEKDELVDLTVLQQETTFRIFFNHTFYKEVPKRYNLDHDKTFYGARQIVTDPEMTVITKTICYRKDDDYNAANMVGESDVGRMWPYFDLPDADDSD